MNFQVALFLCLFSLCSATRVLNLGLSAYGGAVIHSATKSGKYGYFGSIGSVLKVDLDGFIVVGAHYDISIDNPDLFVYGNYIYYVAATVDRYDASTFKKISSIPAAPTNGYVYSAQVSGNYAYLTTGNLSVYDIKKLNLDTEQFVTAYTFPPVDEVPEIVFSYQNYVYIQFKNHILQQIDTTSWTKVNELNYSSYSSASSDHATQFGQYGYIAGSGAQRVIKIDLATLTIVDSGTFTDGITGIIFSSDGSTGYLTTGTTKLLIYIFDTTSLAETGSINTTDYGYNYHYGMYYGNKLFLGSMSWDSNIIQIDTQKKQIINSISAIT